MDTLLIEIGVEEIPAGYIIPALNAFRDAVLNNLNKARIDHGDASIFGTPRRLALQIEKVAKEQKPQTSTITGPPEKVGFDADGNPTIAALKFAEKAGIPPEKIQVVQTSKGRYIGAVVEERCESAKVIVEKMMEKIILSIPFPKRMRWGDLSISFARPIISLTGLLGEMVLDFSVGNIHSAARIMGHSFMSPDPQKITVAEDYVKVAEAAGIIPEIEKRKQTLVAAIQKCARAHDSVILEDPDLVDLVTNLVEYPYPVVGSFDMDFLSVPDAVLITAMREHQKYFALGDKNGKLKNKFIAVNNTKAKDMSLVASGHEKVLRARLSDAKFFYEVDKKSSLDEFAQKLKNVTFQEKLGSVYEKTQRIARLAGALAEASGFDDKPGLSEKVIRAAEICKADLVSQVVIEFTKLQGLIGRVYAQEAGEDPDVALAIEQHYRPVYSGGSLPENPTAAILAIADKLDSICGCFSVDLIPTGGADPYALRRQGIGIIQIMLDQNLEIPLSDMIEKGLNGYPEQEKEAAETAVQIKTFLQNRMVNILVDSGFSKEAVQSALWASFENIPDVLLRVKALDVLRKAPDFEPLAVTFKRVDNIQKKAGSEIESVVKEELFEETAESGLFAEISKAKDGVQEKISQGDYTSALALIATLRPAVDTFFDDVMVMAEDRALRENRIALLGAVSGMFKNIADFSKL